MNILSQEEIELIHGAFKIPPSMSDAEIDAIAVDLMEAYRRSLRVLIGNRIELHAIKEKALSGVQLQEVFLERQRLEELDSLFIEGYYTDVCVAARSLLEYMLQNDCLNEPRIPLEVSAEIDQPGEHNPKISRMYKALKDEGCWDASEDSAVWSVINNGDWTTHTRYDQITQGKRPEDYKMGKAQVTFGFDGVQVIPTSDRLTYEFNRPVEARRMAKESLANLYKLVARHRCD